MSTFNETVVQQYKKRIILVYVVDGETWAVCTWDWAGHEATYGIVLWFRFKRTSVYFDLLFMETWENQNSKSERTGLFCLYCITAKRGFKHVQCFCAAVHTCSQKSLYNSSSSNSAFPKGRRSISHPTAQADDLFAFSTAVRREFEVELSVCLIYLKVEQEESETTSPLNSQWLGSSIPSIIHLADFYIFLHSYIEKSYWTLATLLEPAQIKPPQSTPKYHPRLMFEECCWNRKLEQDMTNGFSFFNDLIKIKIKM